MGVVERGCSGNLKLIQRKLNVGEAMAPPVIREVKKYADSANIVIIDVPPGTSCPVVEAIKESDCCLLVTGAYSFWLERPCVSCRSGKGVRYSLWCGN